MQSDLFLIYSLLNPIHFYLRYPDPVSRIFNRVFSDISDVLKETTLTISHYTETISPGESEIVRVASFSTTEIIDITRFRNKNRIFRVGIP